MNYKYDTFDDIDEAIGKKDVKKYGFCSDKQTDDKHWDKERREAWKRDSDKSIRSIMDKYAPKPINKPSDAS